MVVPELMLLAGNWNNAEFPATPEIGLLCFMASNTGSCNPRNHAALPNIFFNLT